MKDKNFADREIKISYNPLTREFAVWLSLIHISLGIRVVAHAIPHGLHQLQHCPSRFPYQLISGIRLLFVEMEHFVAKSHSSAPQRHRGGNEDTTR